MRSFLLSEKSFLAKEIEASRHHTHQLENERSGVFIEEDKFSFQKLAQLMQDIARAKLAELRLLTSFCFIEDCLSASEGQTISIGSAPAKKGHAYPHALKAGLAPAC